jgi:hypothetical protein
MHTYSRRSLEEEIEHTRSLIDKKRKERRNAERKLANLREMAAGRPHGDLEFALEMISG